MNTHRPGVSVEARFSRFLKPELSAKISSQPIVTCLNDSYCHGREYKLEVFQSGGVVQEIVDRVFYGEDFTLAQRGEDLTIANADRCVQKLLLGDLGRCIEIEDGSLDFRLDYSHVYAVDAVIESADSTAPVFLLNGLDYLSLGSEKRRDIRAQPRRIFVEGEQGELAVHASEPRRFYDMSTLERRLEQRNEHTAPITVRGKRRTIDIFLFSKSKPAKASKKAILFVGGTGKYNVHGESYGTKIGYNLLLERISASFPVFAYQKYPDIYGGWAPTFDQLVDDFSSSFHRLQQMGFSTTAYGHSFGCNVILASNVDLARAILHAPPPSTLGDLMEAQIARTLPQLTKSARSFGARRHAELMNSLRLGSPGNRYGMPKNCIVGQDTYNFLSSSLDIQPSELLKEASDRDVKISLIQGLHDENICAEEVIALYEPFAENKLIYNGSHFDTRDFVIQQVSDFLISTI